MGRTLLHLAARFGHFDVCSLVVETIQFLFVTLKSLEKEQGDLKREEENENERDLMWEWRKDKFGWTPIHLAARYNQTEILKKLLVERWKTRRLLSEGVPTEQQQQQQQQQPQQQQFQRRRKQKSLWSEKRIGEWREFSGVDIGDLKNRTALLLAGFEGLTSLVQLLLDFGADPDLLTTGFFF